MSPRLKDKKNNEFLSENDEVPCRKIGKNSENIEYANQISKEKEYHFYCYEKPLLNLFVSISNYLSVGQVRKNNIFEVVSQYINQQFSGVSSFYYKTNNRVTLLNEGGGGDIELACTQCNITWMETTNIEYSQVLIYPFLESNEYKCFSITYFKQDIDLKSKRKQVEYLMSRCEILMEDYIVNSPKETE